jgi:hypothetical protein
VNGAALATLPRSIRVAAMPATVVNHRIDFINWPFPRDVAPS